MGFLKETTRTKIENITNRGLEVTEIASEKLQEAEISVNVLDNLECIDDDDVNAANFGRAEANEISNSIADLHIDSPTAQLANEFSESSNESLGYANIEHSDANKTGGMAGDYSNIGSNLAESFEASARDFENLAESADAESNDLQSRNSQISGDLRRVFG